MSSMERANLILSCLLPKKKIFNFQLKNAPRDSDCLAFSSAVPFLEYARIHVTFLSQ